MEGQFFLVHNNLQLCTLLLSAYGDITGAVHVVLNGLLNILCKNTGYVKVKSIYLYINGLVATRAHARKYSGLIVDNLGVKRHLLA